MCNTADRLRRELKELNAELDDLYTMSEEAACECYEVDSKEEAISIILDEIESTTKGLEYAELEALPALAGWGYLDPAFDSIDDFNRMRI